MTTPYELPSLLSDLRETLFPRSYHRQGEAFRRVFTNDFLRNLQEALWKTHNKNAVQQTFRDLLILIDETCHDFKTRCRERYLSTLQRSQIGPDFNPDYCYQLLHYIFGCLANCEQDLDDKFIERVFPEAKDSGFLRSYLIEVARVIRYQDHRIPENRIRLPISLVEENNGEKRYHVGWLRISKIPSATRGIFPDPVHLFSTQFGKAFRSSVDRFVAADPELFENNTFVFRFKDLQYPHLLSGPSVSGALWLGSSLLHSFPSHIPDGIIILTKIEEDGRLSAVGDTREKMSAILRELKREYMGPVKIIVPPDELTTAKEVKKSIERSDIRGSFSVEILSVGHIDELKSAADELQLRDYPLINAPTLVEERHQSDFLDSLSPNSPLTTENIEIRKDPLRWCAMPCIASNHVETETIRQTRIDCRERLRTSRPGRVLFHGPGAIGKTQLILSLGQNLRDSFQEILFVDLKGYSHLEVSSRTCSEHILADLSGYRLSELKTWSDQDIAIAFTRAVQRRLQNKQRILFLLDNVRELRQIAPILIGDLNPNIWYMITARENLPLQNFEPRSIPRDWCSKDAKNLAKLLLPKEATTEDVKEFLDQTGHNPLAITMAGNQWSTSRNNLQRVAVVQRARQSATERFLETLNGLQPPLRDFLLAVSWLPNDFTAEHVQYVWDRIEHNSAPNLAKDDDRGNIGPEPAITELVDRGWFIRMSEEAAPVKRFSLHDVNREELQKHAQVHLSLEQRERFILDLATYYSQSGRYAERGLTQTSIRNELLSLESTNLLSVLDGLRKITTEYNDSIRIRGEFAAIWGKMLVREVHSKRQQRLELIDQLINWIETYGRQLEQETNGLDNDSFFIERYELWIERAKTSGKKRHQDALHAFQTAYQLVQDRDPARTLEVLQKMVYFCKDKHPQQAFQYASEYLEQAKKDNVNTQANAYTLLAKVNSLEHPLVALKNFLKALDYLRSTNETSEHTRKLLNETNFHIAENAKKLDYLTLALQAYQQGLDISFPNDESGNHDYFIQCLSGYLKTIWLTAEGADCEPQSDVYEPCKLIINQYLLSQLLASDYADIRKIAISSLPLLGLLFLAESRRNPKNPGYNLPDIVKNLRQWFSLNVIQPSDLIAFAEERLAEAITWNTFRHLAFHLRRLTNDYFAESPIRATLYLTIAKREILEHNLRRGQRLLWKAIRVAELHSEHYLCGVILEEIVDLTMNIDDLLEITTKLPQIRDIHCTLKRDDHTTNWNTVSFKISILELKCQLLRNELSTALPALASLLSDAHRDGLLNTTTYVPQLLQGAIIATPVARRAEQTNLILKWLQDTPVELQLNSPSVRIDLLAEVLKRVDQMVDRNFIEWILQTIKEIFLENRSMSDYITAACASHYLRDPDHAVNFVTALSLERLVDESVDAKILSSSQLSARNYFLNLIALATGRLSDFRVYPDANPYQETLILTLLSLLGDYENASAMARGLSEKQTDKLDTKYAEHRTTQANNDLEMGRYRETFETIWNLSPAVRSSEQQIACLCLEAALHRCNGDFLQGLLLAHRGLLQATLSGLAEEKFLFVYEELARNYARLGDARNTIRSLKKAHDWRTSSFLVQDRANYLETCVDCFLSLGNLQEAEIAIETLRKCISTIESEFYQHRYQSYRYRFLLASGKQLEQNESTDLLDLLQSLQERHAWYILSDLVDLIDRSPRQAPLVLGVARTMKEYVKTKQVNYLTVLQTSTLSLDASCFSNGDPLAHQRFGRTDRFRAIRPKDIGNRPKIGGIFEEMEKHFDASGSKGIRAVYQFNITGEEGGLWAFSVDNGTCHSIRGGVRAPTVEVELSADTWFAIREGSLNSQTAFGRGLLRIRGDMSIAVQLMSCFPLA
jgi:putative sterol carrier protein